MKPKISMKLFLIILNYSNKVKWITKNISQRLGEYLVSSSALNFLNSRIILEIKTSLDKGISRKSSITDSSSPSSMSTTSSGLGGGSGSSSSAGGGFGIDNFVDSGGSVNSFSKDYDLPKPQEAPSFKPVDIVIPKQESNTIRERKNCIVCAALIPKQAKFCNKCGNSQ